ncbi:MAG: hypothetical protein NC102_02065 [Clostridium sp.]|nr:hypothetical protein [Clostridium sp.]
MLKMKYAILAAALAIAISAGAQTMEEDGKLYTIADTVMSMPEFPGGEGPMLMYFDAQIPNKNISGRELPVYCTFKVSRLGEIDYGGIEFLHRQADGKYTAGAAATPYERAVKDAIKRLPGFIPAETFDYSVAYQHVLTLNGGSIDSLLAVKEEIPDVTKPRPAAPYAGGKRRGPSRPDGVYTNIDRCDAAPQYPGGNKALYSDLKKVMRIPHVYSHQKRIYCSFVVLENGDIDPTTIKCVRNVDGHYRQADQYTTWEKCIMEGMAQISGFTPARDQGKSVPYEYVLPFVFGR